MEENKKKMSKSEAVLITIFITVIVILLIVIGVLYSERLKYNNAKSELDTILGSRVNNASLATVQNSIGNTAIGNKTTSTTEEGKVTTENLSQEELKYFTEYFNQKGNNGFILSSYEDVNNISFASLLYNGITESESTLTEQEKSDYLKQTGTTEIYGDMLKLTTSQIKDFFKDKTGISISSEKIKENGIRGVYISKYDAYYDQRTDSNGKAITCTKGTKTSDGNYSVSYKDNNDKNYTGTISLKKVNGKYLVVSNKLDNK